MVRLWCSWSKTQSLLRVVAIDQILDNGTGLPQSNAGIGVVDGWQPTVGINGDVLGLLDIRERNSVDLIWKAEFLQEDGDFVRIGTFVTEEDDRFGL